ncbi:MAG: DEAD/DEAH box helicase family protein [Rhodobacteraceae bacterium]|nr:DEAD/DEAH box helicase family protein [Paracoccaceae bacterium]
MHELIRTATAELAAFLADHLPVLGEDWWETHVANRLSFQQQRTVEERGLTKLEQLDFAALLRILDQNWYELSQALNLPREGRTWVRELQSVRNRWAHLPAAPVPAEDLYRDADTLARVLDMLGAAPASVEAAESAKRHALSDLAVPSDAPPNSKPDPANNVPPTAPSDGPTIPAVPTHTATTMFEVGDLVALRSDPDTVVPIIGVTASTAETRYQVFQDNRQAAYYESQLLPLEPADESSLLSAADLRAHLTSLHLLSPSTANLYSLRSGRVHFVPYQYRPVVRLIRADRPRLLIADEVGVGKTIEAGLIIKELRARTNISSVLVICPKALVTERKWFVEMKRFDEHFEALDGRTLRHCLRETNLEGEWPDRYARAIIPFSLFDSDLLFGKEGRVSRASEGLLGLDPPPRFDLVIVDEAHHIRNADTFLHQAVRYFCDNAQAAVFLTATPVQLGSQDLFTLLNVLRPDLVIDRPSFEQMAAPNGFINAAVGHCRAGVDHWQVEARACLGHAAQTEWGRLFLRESPAFQDIYDRLAEEHIDDASRIRIIRSLEELYTFSPMINRTRRRDIGEFTSRRPETLTVEFTPDQRRLHDDLLDVVSRILAHAHGKQNVKFMMTTIRRQAASCLYGLAPLLRDMLAGKLDSLEEMDGTDGEPPVDAAFLADIQADIEALLERADDLDPLDPKVQAFVSVLRDKDRMANNKALVFSTFRHTLAYIEKHVADAGLRYGLVHGGVQDNQRADQRRRLALSKDDPEALDVLLSSEVGGEGLDFQFCDLLVNYDLPWNPMRIDRYGQRSENVAIVNLVTPGTVDADIYERCLMRIGVFHHAVGGSEEILGDITREIHNIADSFALTPEQRAERLQQLADNKIRQVQEETALEEKQAELFGLTVPNQSWREEIAEAKSFWLSAEALQRCVAAYLSGVAETDGDFLLGDKPLKTLRLGQKIRARLLGDFRSQPRSTDPVARQWEKWLRGTDPLLPVTFEQETAAAEPKAVYLNVLHPLVRQAARHLERAQAVQVSLIASSEAVPPGEYPFALYQWRNVGIRSDDTLVAVSSDPELDSAVMSLLEVAADAPCGTPPDEAAIERLDNRHHGEWRAARANHMAENRELVQHRRQSLSTSHGARCKLLEDQIGTATNDKIRQMKEGELARANYDYEHRVAELERLAESADIHATLIVEGMLRVTRDDVA